MTPELNQTLKGSIYLCGFMASGKSKLGKALASKLDLEFRDLDTEIVEREQRSIREIFEEQGEASFRRIEWECLLELTRSFTGVVALGGGSLQNQQIVDHLKVHGLLIFLETPLEVITERVSRNTRRPFLYDEKGNIKSRETLFKQLKSLYSERISFYKQAQITLDTSLFSSVEEKTDEVIKKIKRHV